MARILTVDPDRAEGLRKLVVRMMSRQFDGELPGVFNTLLSDFQVAISTSWLVYYLPPNADGCFYVRFPRLSSLDLLPDDAR